MQLLKMIMQKIHTVVCGTNRLFFWLPSKITYCFLQNYFTSFSHFFNISTLLPIYFSFQREERCLFHSINTILYLKGRVNVKISILFKSIFSPLANSSDFHGCNICFPEFQRSSEVSFFMA